jgi:hypothetical protein
VCTRPWPPLPKLFFTFHDHIPISFGAITFKYQNQNINPHSQQPYFTLWRFLSKSSCSKETCILISMPNILILSKQVTTAPLLYNLTARLPQKTPKTIERVGIVVTLHIRIREMLDLNLARSTGYPEIFRDFPQLLQANVRDKFSISPRLLPPKFCQSHPSSNRRDIIQLLKASLNKPQEDINDHYYVKGEARSVQDLFYPSNFLENRLPKHIRTSGTCSWRAVHQQDIVCEEICFAILHASSQSTDVCRTSVTYSQFCRLFLLRVKIVTSDSE